MEKVNQRVMISKKLLKDGLLRLLESKTIDKLTVTELCREACINRATFYAHYETANDILMEIERDLVSEMEREQLKNSNWDFQTRVEAMCSYLYERRELVRILFKNCSGMDLSNLMNEIYEKVLISYLPKNVDADDVKLVTAYLSGGGVFLLSLWLQHGIPKTPQHIAKLITGLFSEASFNKAHNSIWNK